MLPAIVFVSLIVTAYGQGGPVLLLNECSDAPTIAAFQVFVSSIPISFFFFR